MPPLITPSPTATPPPPASKRTRTAVSLDSGSSPDHNLGSKRARTSHALDLQATKKDSTLTPTMSSDGDDFLYDDADDFADDYDDDERELLRVKMV